MDPVASGMERIPPPSRSSVLEDERWLGNLAQGSKMVVTSSAQQNHALKAHRAGWL